MTELNHETTFPKTGRVNEVCREWVVREDNALAQQLQSQEISEHYRGNRYRNQVVRQDFPTALSEQIKEKEVADQQSALYHQMLNAQAEADAAVARQVAENLRREQELERRRNIEQSEYLARKFDQELAIQPTHHSSRSFPSPSEAIVNELPIPPKKSAIKFNGQRRNYNDSDMVSNPSYVTAVPMAAGGASPSSSAAAALPQTSPPSARDSPQLNYVSLELNIPKDSQKRLANHHATQYTQVFAHNPSTPPAPLSPSDSDSHHYEHINLHSHTPEKKTTPQPYAQRDYSFPSPPLPLTEPVGLPPKPIKSQQISPSKNKNMQYELPKLPPKAKDKSPTNQGVKIQLLTTDSFDMLMGNRMAPERTDECDSLATGGANPKVARNSERVFNSNTPNINRIDSVNDILSYDGDEAAGSASSSDRIRQMRELGVPADEILEIDRRLTQQEKDEELARRLQEEEEGQGCLMTQEEKDRMVAIEAQDKELARMLQEREKAKARRAKERARARKLQMQQEKMQQEGFEAPQYVSENASSVTSHTRSHSDSNDIEHDSYSDPIDLINARENAKQSYQAGEYHHSKQSSGASRDSLFHSDEPYANPVDSLRNTTAMVDSNHNASPPRPSKKHSSKAPRPKSNESLDNYDPTNPNSTSSGQSVTNPIPSNEAQSFLPAHLKYTTPDQNSNPIPPYMPIQGVRRNGNIQMDKKKKPKDNRCTHQ